ncbi:MAG TPA: ferredoxin reductase [Micromonosporaceae bacterium]
MARAAVLGRLTWQVATIADVRRESSTAVTLVLDDPDWTSHLPGQHVDVKLTADDGYFAERSYSIASAPAEGRLEITVQRVADGEVSPYLCDVAGPGDQIELRGPIGGYFVWSADRSAPVLLIGGGSGVVPLMAMVRSRANAGSRTPFRLMYSVRTPDDALYADELRRRVRDDQGVDVAWAYTRKAPDGWPGHVGRIDAARLGADGWPATLEPDVFVCGPTGFVEAIADMLVAAGHESHRIRTERFGPTGG